MYEQNMPMFCETRTVSVGSQISIISYLPYGYENLFCNFLTTEKKNSLEANKSQGGNFLCY